MKLREWCCLALLLGMMGPVACVSLPTASDSSSNTTTAVSTTNMTGFVPCPPPGQLPNPCAAPPQRYLLSPKAWEQTVHWLPGSQRPIYSSVNAGQYFPPETEAGYSAGYSATGSIWSRTAAMGYSTISTTTTQTGVQ